MTILEVSQIMFNVVISLAVIVVGVLISAISFEVLKFITTFKKFLEDIRKESSELYEKINNFTESMLKLSFIADFFKRRKKK